MHRNDYFHFQCYYFDMNDIEASCWQFNIGSGDDLVPSGNKSLPEPMLTKVHDALWGH